MHLRFGPVARGGLRWSDRAQDYRTEVLGLVKAQQVKNAVIVPVGAKGGFYPKRSDRRPLPRPDLRGRAAAPTSTSSPACCRSPTTSRAAASCRRRTSSGAIQDDPYFVVAADKGTATFSDTANAISQKHGFWLDDAFASGGSAGYDHKKMGITAKGAWEAVKRHFREMNRDIQTTPFTVVGVGDMSGDVFGNGMLLSDQTRLIAAFDHRDIFIDPDPDPARLHGRAPAHVRAAALELAGLRQVEAFGRRRHRLAQPEIDHAARCRGRGDRPRKDRRVAGRDHEGHPQGAGRPALVRRHRHLCARHDRDQPGCRRPRQRRDPRHRRRSQGQGDRRRRQSRRHPARPHRVRPARRRLQFRRHRQFGRRQLLGRRGQHQDRAGVGDAARRADASGARQAARRDDRRGRRSSCLPTTTSRRWRSPSPARPAWPTFRIRRASWRRSRRAACSTARSRRCLRRRRSPSARRAASR